MYLSIGFSHCCKFATARNDFFPSFFGVLLLLRLFKGLLVQLSGLFKMY